MKTEKVKALDRATQSAAIKAALKAAENKKAGPVWPGPAPEEGVFFVGYFVSKRMVPNRKKKDTMQALYTMRDEEGVAVRIFGSTVLDSEFEELAPEVGDKLLILFRGRMEKGSDGNQPAKLFSVVHVDE